MTSKTMFTKNRKTTALVSSAQPYKSETETTSTTNTSNLGYAIDLARAAVSNPSFQLNEISNIRLDQRDSKDYSTLAMQRFRYGGSAALTVKVSRQVERSMGPLSQTDRARLHNYVKTGLRTEYIDAISAALDERASSRTW